MAYKNFQRGTSTYLCYSCERRTRAVGDEINTVLNGTGLCADCFELAGLENAHFDGCLTTASEIQNAYNAFKFVLDNHGKNVAPTFPELAKAVGWK